MRTSQNTKGETAKEVADRLHKPVEAAYARARTKAVISTTQERKLQQDEIEAYDAYQEALEKENVHSTLAGYRFGFDMEADRRDRQKQLV